MHIPSVLNLTDIVNVSTGDEGRSGSDCGSIWIDGDLLFGALAVAGALLAYYLYITITMKGRRRKRREGGDSISNWLDYIVIGKSETDVVDLF